MQRKILKHLTFVIVLALAGALNSFVSAQKLPQALQSNTVLSPVNRATYEAAAKAYETNPNQQNRNKLIFMAVYQIDLNFGVFVKQKRHRNDFFQTVLDILEVGAATAISISNGERAKSVIADALGFVQGSRTRINKNLRLLEQQILVNKMIEKRSVALANIYEKTNDSNDQYPFERAYIDILAYYQAGTTDSALSSLATDTGASATAAQKDLIAAKRKANIIVAPTTAQITISRANSDFVQGFVDSYDDAGDKITDADAKIAAAVAVIAAENAKAAPNAAAVNTATANKAAAEAAKTAAQASQTAAKNKLKAIFNAIEQDPVLSPLFDELPEKYPNLDPPIEESLARIRAKNGTLDDYGSVLLKFFGLVTDAANDDPTIVDRAKNLVDSFR